MSGAVRLNGRLARLETRAPKLPEHPWFASFRRWAALKGQAVAEGDADLERA